MAGLTFELVVALTVAAIAVIALTAVVFAVGFPFGLTLGTAVGVAGYSLVVLFPGGMNLWIAASGSSGEDTTERVTAAANGTAVIVGITSILVAPRVEREYSIALCCVAGGCLLLFLWALWRDSRHQNQKLESAGLIKHD